MRGCVHVQFLHLRVGGADASRINVVRRLMNFTTTLYIPPLSLSRISQKRKNIAVHSPPLMVSFFLSFSLLSWVMDLLFYLGFHVKQEIFTKSTNQPKKKKLKWDTTFFLQSTPSNPYLTSLFFLMIHRRLTS